MSKRQIDQAAADRASGMAGKQITFRRGEEIHASECVSTTQTCPSCKGFHPILPIIRRDDKGHAWMRCPQTNADMVETPAGIFIPVAASYTTEEDPTQSPFELEEEMEEVTTAPLPARPSVIPQQQTTAPAPVAKTVFAAVRAKIKIQHSPASFQLAKGLIQRLREVEKENQEVDREIERLQKLRASLSTEHLWLQHTVEGFNSVAETAQEEGPATQEDAPPPQAAEGQKASKSK